jgi:hypothetical protein
MLMFLAVTDGDEQLRAAIQSMGEATKMYALADETRAHKGRNYQNEHKTMIVRIALGHFSEMEPIIEMNCRYDNCFGVKALRMPKGQCRQ